MNILITGNRGFIGSHAVEHFKNKHHVSTFEWGETFPSLENIDTVMHFGAISSTAETDVEKVMRQNLDFSIELLNRCIEYGVNLQYSSSASVYGMKTDFAETAAPDPKTAYAWSKYLFDRYVQTHQSQFDITVQGFRYFNVYGEKGEDHKGDQSSPHHKFRKQAIAGCIRVFENSDQYLRDFVHVSKIIDTHQQFLDVTESGIWNIGTGKPQSFLDVARSIAVEYDASIQEIPMPEHMRRSYQSYTCADLTKLEQTLAKFAKKQ